MQHLKKIFQTAGVEREEPYLRLNNYLMQFRATPHATVKKCPVELLFGRRFNTKLPDLRTNPAKERKDIKEAKKEDELAKQRMKKYKDGSRHVKEHDIKGGDLVISKRKTTKHNSIYDPMPYKVVAVYGTQVKGMREDGKHKTRDSKKRQRVQVQARRRYGELERPSKYLDETDIGAGNIDEEGRGREVPGQDIGGDMYKDEGAGRGDTYEGKGVGRQERGQGSEDTDSEAEGAGRHELNEARGAGRWAATTTC